MPFTLAHGAAALPFRRFRLVTSGVLIGTFAPDFEYFLRLAPHGRFGHTLAGAILLTLPVALVALWLFHDFVKFPVARLLPDAIRSRLANHLHDFRFRGAARFALIVGSVLLGIATHLFWDAFTHVNTWPYHHWAWLRQPIRVPVAGLYPFYKVLQHLSTVVGLGVLCIWLAHWYRSTEPSRQALDNPISSQRAITIWAIVMSGALVGAAVRAILGSGIPIHSLAPKRFVSQFVITLIVILWWELVAYGVFSSKAERC